MSCISVLHILCKRIQELTKMNVIPVSHIVSDKKFKIEEVENKKLVDCLEYKYGIY